VKARVKLGDPETPQRHPSALAKVLSSSVVGLITQANMFICNNLRTSIAGNELDSLDSAGPNVDGGHIPTQAAQRKSTLNPTSEPVPHNQPTTTHWDAGTNPLLTHNYATAIPLLTHVYPERTQS